MYYKVFLYPLILYFNHSSSWIRSRRSPKVASLFFLVVTITSLTTPLFSSLFSFSVTHSLYVMGRFWSNGLVYFSLQVTHLPCSSYVLWNIWLVLLEHPCLWRRWRYFEIVLWSWIQDSHRFYISRFPCLFL